MYKAIITPRVCDTDALGHINNTNAPIWFEGAREPIFRLFTPDLRTFISRIGGASFDVYQELWQHGEKCVSGTAAMVHFDFGSQKSKKISDDIKVELTQHLYEAIIM